MNALYALFAEPQAASRAVEALRRAGPEAGFDAGQIVVLTGEPIEGVEEARGARHKTPQYALAALGGVLGGLGAYGLLDYAQTSYPIVTGAMPIMPWWSNGIILYECAMLGAIIATVIVLLVGLRLPNRAPLSDPEVWNGKILVGVTNPPASSRTRLEELLGQAGAAAVKQFPLPGS